MTIIHRTRSNVAYAEVSCADCGTRVVVSEDALEFYARSMPFTAYLCPACRRKHRPDAALYAEVGPEEKRR